MNRIRKYNNKYQVLITPHQKYNTGFEFMLGSWTDEGLMGFEVKEFDTFDDAKCESMDQPDINWEQLVDFHKDNFYFLTKEITNLVSYTRMAIEFIPKLLSPEQTKNIMFDRVIKGQTDDKSNFRLVYDMNDIINFIITNPWNHNLKELELHLIKQSRLNIFRKFEKNTVIHLIGRTDIGTTYEIILMPDLIYNWVKWKTINSQMNEKQIYDSLHNVIKTQQTLDKMPRIR